MQVTVHEVVAAHGSSPVVVSSSVDALKSQSVTQQFSACSVSEFGYGGEKICTTGVLEVFDSNGNLAECFVIGTSRTIWHAWPGSNGWHSLGGVARHSTSNGVGSWPCGSYTINTIDTTRTNGELYCDDWGPQLERLVCLLAAPLR